MLCNISKVLERIIYNKLIYHVSCQINPAQFGFMQNRSTTQQLLIFLSNVFIVHHQLDTIYLDISKAFDTICHTHLLQKLSVYNISSHLWFWFKNYLTKRFQFVSINSSHSHLLPVVSGVPQCSILGPFLFILYMNDLPDVIHWSRALLFANDTKCFKHTMMTSNPFKLTCMIWLPRVSHLIYLSILLRVSMYHLIRQFSHHITSEVIPSTLLIATKILEL